MFRHSDFYVILCKGTVRLRLRNKIIFPLLQERHLAAVSVENSIQAKLQVPEKVLSPRLDSNPGPSIHKAAVLLIELHCQTEKGSSKLGIIYSICGFTLLLACISFTMPQKCCPEILPILVPVLVPVPVPKFSPQKGQISKNSRKTKTIVHYKMYWKQSQVEKQSHKGQQSL